MFVYAHFGRRSRRLPGRTMQGQGFVGGLKLTCDLVVVFRAKRLGIDNPECPLGVAIGFVIEMLCEVAQW